MAARAKKFVIKDDLDQTKNLGLAQNARQLGTRVEL